MMLAQEMIQSLSKCKGRAFVKGDMTGFKAFYFILRVFCRCVMLIAVDQKGRRMNGFDPSTDVSRFRVPRYDVSDLESL